MSISSLIKTNPFYLTVPASLFVHAVVLGMHFDLPKPGSVKHAPLLDITLVRPNDIKAPDKADFLAQSNQKGSGSKEQKSRLTSRMASTEPVLDVGDQSFKSEKSQPDIAPKLEPLVLTTKGKTTKQVDKQPEKDEVLKPKKKDSEISEQADMIAKLMAEMSKQEERYAKRPRIHFIDSLSAKSAVEAEYIHNWSKKLERIGNINFPQKALDLSLSGTLILNATLDRAGRVVEMQISVSSGSRILDDAALRIVKLAAPYPPLPKEIREKYDRLNITRTIVFHKKGGKALFYSK